MLIIALAVSCFSYSIYITLRYASQAPLDFFAFRQTQTALTTYWLIKNGFSLTYETPVAGPPWSIPFELPVYQYIVALVSEITKYSLNATGRVVSFIFLALCVVPVKAITASLDLSRSVLHVFVILLFSSPLYLYWGRTFMIETTAVFFSLVAIKYFTDILLRDSSLWRSSLFLLFMSLSILQKATTGLPVLAVLSVVYLLWNVKRTSSLRELLSTRRIALALTYFGIPLALGIIWVSYTDQIKTLNPLGAGLTSKALNAWNWGSLGQRISSDLYLWVGWERIFRQNLSGPLGVGLLAIALLSTVRNSVKSAILTSILLGVLPLLLFTNLHLIHSYYQAANVVFFIYALSVAVVQIVEYHAHKTIILFVLCMVMVGSNYRAFRQDYTTAIEKEYSSENSRDYAVAEVLKREMPEEKVFVAFGNDWDSSLAYMSERKSFTVPVWFNRYAEIARNPESFVPEVALGAIVLCPSKNLPTLADLQAWSSNNRQWKIREVHGCYISLPEKQS